MSPKVSEKHRVGMCVLVQHVWQWKCVYGLAQVGITFASLPASVSPVSGWLAVDGSGMHVWQLLASPTLG